MVVTFFVVKENFFALVNCIGGVSSVKSKVVCVVCVYSINRDSFVDFEGRLGRGVFYLLHIWKRGPHDVAEEEHTNVFAFRFLLLFGSPMVVGWLYRGVCHG